MEFLLSKMIPLENWITRLILRRLLLSVPHPSRINMVLVSTIGPDYTCSVLRFSDEYLVRHTTHFVSLQVPHPVGESEKTIKSKLGSRYEGRGVIPLVYSRCVDIVQGEDEGLQESPCTLSVSHSEPTLLSRPMSEMNTLLFPGVPLHCIDISGLTRHCSRSLS